MHEMADSLMKSRKQLKTTRILLEIWQIPPVVSIFSVYFSNVSTLIFLHLVTYYLSKLRILCTVNLREILCDPLCYVMRDTCYTVNLIICFFYFMPVACTDIIEDFTS